MTRISRETFCNALDNIANVCYEADYLAEVYGLDGIAKNFVDTLVAQFVSVVQEAMDDAEEGATSFFVYDCDFGRHFIVGDYADEEGNGEDVDLSTPGKLYDYLVS